MSEKQPQAPAYTPQPTPSNPSSNPTDRAVVFHEEAKKHECHHYMRTYGGQMMNAMMWGFGATMGADAANAAFGEGKKLVGEASQEWWRH